MENKNILWVKASERLPGWKTPVKWRLDGIERGTSEVYYMAHAENSATLIRYEWLDESATPSESPAEQPVVLTQDRADLIREVNGRDLNGLQEQSVAINEPTGPCIYPDLETEAKEHAKCITNDAEHQLYVAQGYYNAMAKARAIPAAGREENDWIDVNDRLPEDPESNSVYCIVYDVYWGVVIRPYNQAHECWDSEDGDDYYTDAKGGKITHWKPIPKAPFKQRPAGSGEKEAGNA